MITQRFGDIIVTYRNISTGMVELHAEGFKTWEGDLCSVSLEMAKIQGGLQTAIDVNGRLETVMFMEISRERFDEITRWAESQGYPYTSKYLDDAFMGKSDA